MGIRFLWNKVASCRKSFFGFHHDAVVRQVLEECARHCNLMHFFLTEQFNAFIFCFRSNLWLVLVVLYYLEYSLDLFKAIAIFALVCLTLWYGIRLLLTTGWGKQARCFHELLFVIYLCDLLQASVIVLAVSNLTSTENQNIVYSLAESLLLRMNRYFHNCWVPEAWSRLFKGWRAVSIG